MTPTGSTKGKRASKATNAKPTQKRAPERVYETNSEISCPSCGSMLRVRIRSMFDAYFKNREVVCPQCKVLIDWWVVVRRAIEFAVFGHAFIFLGGRSIVLRAANRAGRKIVISASRAKIPRNAKILAVNITPEGLGSPFPLVVHGNSYPSHDIPRTLVLYPAPLAKKSKDGNVSVMIVWIAEKDRSAAFKMLFDALRLYTAREYSYALVLANAAIEIGTSAAVKSYFGKMAIKGNATPNAIGHAYRLANQLPALAKHMRLPALPEKAAALLAKLNSQRNKIVHDGLRAESMARDDIADLLSSAVVGYFYVDMIGRRLARA